MVTQTEDEKDIYSPQDISAAEQSDAYSSAGIDQAESFANDPKNATKQSEENPTNFSNEVEQNKSGFRSIPDKVKVLFSNKKSRNAAVGVVGATGIVGVLFTVFGPMSLVVSMTENLVSTNDGAERAFNRRIMKVLYTKMGMNTDNPEACLSKKVKCKMNTITTKGVKKFAKKGVVALDKDGNDLSKSKGKYPSSKVAVWAFDPGDGGKPVRVKPKDLKGFLANNPKMAAKLIGRSGAINLRFELWRGKFIKKHLYDRFKISRNGGLAGEDGGRSKVSESLKKLKSKLPGLDGLSDKAATNSKKKINKMVGKGKKGGIGYLVAVGGCVVVKAPSIITGAVAATQAARIMPLVMDLVLSPGSMVKGSYATNPKPEAVENVLNTLTATDKNGKSALDSKILLGAAGVNTAQVTPSEKFTPGYKLLTNDVMTAARKINRGAEPACNVILSPQAMYTAMALNTAITVAASSTVVLGILKVGAEFTVSWIVGKAAEKATEYASKKAIDSLAKNDDLDKILEGKPGEDLGDALGISAMTFFSTGAAARYVPVLKESQLKTVKALNEEDDRRTRQIELATLSPFDISSKYTFLGSILNNVNMSIMSSRYTGYFSGAMSYLLHSPLSLLYSGASAADASYSENYCGNATEFGMDTNDGSTPAINAAGMPCYGFTGDISTERAIDIATGSNKASEKWVKDDFSDEATVDEIVEEDTRLADYIDGCGAAAIEAGEWTENSAGCTVDTADNNSTSIGSILESCSEEVTTDCTSGEAGETNTKSSTPEESEALAAFVMDYQISQSVDGFDEEEVPTSYSGAGSKFKIGTFNILYSTARPHDWVERLNRSINVIESNQLDVVGLQEVRKNQWSRLKSSDGLGESYDIFPRKYDSAYANTNPVIWNSSRFRLVEGGYISGYRVHSSGYENKSYIKVKLEDISTGQQFYLINLHHPAGGDSITKKKRYDDSLNLRKEVEKLTDAPVFLTGDFNAGLKRIKRQGVYLKEVRNLSYCILTRGGLVINAYDARDNKTGNCPTQKIKTDDGGHDPSPVDHIYMSPSVQIVKEGNGLQSRGVWRSMKGPKNNGSDAHDTVMANILIPGAGSLDGSTIDEPSYDKDLSIKVDEPPGGDHKPSNCTSGFTVGAKSLSGVIKSKWPSIKDIGGFSCRKNTASNTTSVHGVGRALDIMVNAKTPSGLRTGNEIRNFLINNAKTLGVQRVIWDKHIWSANISGWRDYTGPNPHTDHIHAEINLEASKKGNLGSG